MPIPYVPHPASFHHYSSWGWHDPWAHTPSYFRPYHVEYAAPRESSCVGQPCVENDRFKPKYRSKVQEKKKAVKQIYVVKRDGHKNISSDLNSIDEKPIHMLKTSAIDGNRREESNVDIPSVKPEQKELSKPEIKKKSLLSRTEAKPSHPLGLLNWQKKTLQGLSAQELKKRNLAWVPKGSAKSQDKIDVQAKDATQLKEKRRSER